MKLSYCQRVCILIGIVFIGLIGLLAMNPIPQDPNYHLFADSRTYFSVPNFYNVVSNSGFAVVGALGALAPARWKRHGIFLKGTDAWPYAVFFFGVTLVSLGSAYYHWAPSNERLLWDRLPITIALMAFVSAIVADRIDRKAGNIWLLPVLVALGLLSLAYWDWTEAAGSGDLRFYAFLQFYPMVLIPFVLWMFPERLYTTSRYIIWAIAWYGLSKILEYFDYEVFDILSSTISGHTLKHLAATTATFVVLRILIARRLSLDTP